MSEHVGASCRAAEANVAASCWMRTRTPLQRGKRKQEPKKQAWGDAATHTHETSRRKAEGWSRNIVRTCGNVEQRSRQRGTLRNIIRSTLLRSNCFSVIPPRFAPMRHENPSLAMPAANQIAICSCWARVQATKACFIELAKQWGAEIKVYRKKGYSLDYPTV